MSVTIKIICLMLKASLKACKTFSKLFAAIKIKHDAKTSKHSKTLSIKLGLTTRDNVMRTTILYTQRLTGVDHQIVR